MSEDKIDFDGNISICHTVEYYETVSLAEYNLRTAIQFMNAEELDKVIRYIKRITKNRFPLRSDSKRSLKKIKFRGKEIF